MIHSKGLSLEPKGSLLHHNYIVNSSIIIKIIVNGRNKTSDFLMIDSSMEDEDSNESLFLIDPDFERPANGLNPEIVPNGEPKDGFMPYQKPSIGRVQILDRYNRPLYKTSHPDTTSSAVTTESTTPEDPDEYVG